jgi:hypothetical protein
MVALFTPAAALEVDCGVVADVAELVGFDEGLGPNDIREFDDNNVAVETLSVVVVDDDVLLQPWKWVSSPRVRHGCWIYSQPDRTWCHWQR